MTTKTLSDLSKMDTFDSLDLIERMEELQAMKEDVGLTDEEKEELRDIKHINKEGTFATGEEWRYGVTCIRESSFKEYAMDFAEECGVIQRNITWPLTCIDWDMAARDLSNSYTELDVDGVTFLVR